MQITVTKVTERRIEWTELRDGELYFVVAESSGADWEFSERSSWETRYFPLPATGPRMEMVESAKRDVIRASIRCPAVPPVSW